MAKTKIAVLVSGGGTNLQALIDAQGKVLNSGEIIGASSKSISMVYLLIPLPNHLP